MLCEKAFTRRKLAMFQPGTNKGMMGLPEDQVHQAGGLDGHHCRQSQDHQSQDQVDQEGQEDQGGSSEVEEVQDGKEYLHRSCSESDPRIDERESYQ